MLALASLERVVMAKEVAEKLDSMVEGKIEFNPVNHKGYATWEGAEDIDPDTVSVTMTEVLVEVQEMLETFPNIAFMFKMVPKTNTISSAQIEILNRFEALVNKIEHLKFDMNQEVNNRVNVHVPNLGLLQVNEVQVVTDICTEALQEEWIDEGWRILAICPQPNQRRPDYVLGRTK